MSVPTGVCWFCKRAMPTDALIAGYDTFDEQRLACLACNERMSGNWSPDAPRVAGLDVERLARAMDAVFAAGSDLALPFVAKETQPEYARRVAAEYARIGDTAALAASPDADPS